MFSGFIFFREVHISLISLILVIVIRYQDQSLRKNLLPTCPRGFSKGTKINAYSFKQESDFNDQHWRIMNKNHNRYGNANEWHLLSLCPPVTPALYRFIGKCTSRSLVTLRECHMCHSEITWLGLPQPSSKEQTGTLQWSSSILLLHHPSFPSGTFCHTGWVFQGPPTWSLWHKTGIKQIKALSSGISDQFALRQHLYFRILNVFIHKSLHL